VGFSLKGTVMFSTRFIHFVSVTFFALVLPSDSAQAESMTVLNPGFKEPYEGKIQDDFNQIPEPVVVGISYLKKFK